MERGERKCPTKWRDTRGSPQQSEVSTLAGFMLSKYAFVSNKSALNSAGCATKYISIYTLHATDPNACHSSHMSTARHLIALLRTHVQGDETEFLSVAMEMAAREARLGHAKVAEQIRDLVDQARTRNS